MITSMNNSIDDVVDFEPNIDLAGIEPYVDHVVTHRDGTKRVARLGLKKDYWQLASYDRTRKNDYCWSLENVVCAKRIDFS